MEGPNCRLSHRGQRNQKQSPKLHARQCVYRQCACCRSVCCHSVCRRDHAKDGCGPCVFGQKPESRTQKRDTDPERFERKQARVPSGHPLGFMDHQPDQQKIAGNPGDEQSKKMVGKRDAQHANPQQQNQQLLATSVPVTSEITTRIRRHVDDHEQDQSRHDPREAVGPKETRIRHAKQGHWNSFLRKCVVS